MAARGGPGDRRTRSSGGFDDRDGRASAEADEFYAELTPPGATADEAMVLRQAFAGLLWSKQFYHYDVRALARRRPGPPAPPSQADRQRNRDWRHMSQLRRHLDAGHVGVSRGSPPGIWPSTAWRWPRSTPEFAKQQLLLLLREWYLHPNGQLPAYEWDVRRREPAGARLGGAAGVRDRRRAGLRFLPRRVLHKLLLNFTWWVNRKDADGNNVFEGGFLGLDNIGPFDRSAHAAGAAACWSRPTAPAWMAHVRAEPARDRR